MAQATYLDGPSPRWFTIASHRPFLRDLAHGLLDALGEGLAEAVVLTPSRRSVRALGEAFVETIGGRALLLPQVRALGDLDEGEAPFEPGRLAQRLPPAIAPFRRRFELARLVAEHAPLFGRSIDATGALELADAMAAFLDSVELEEVAKGDRLDRLEMMVEGDLAAHWRISADVLRIALEAWPARLAELGLMDLSARRVRLLRMLAEDWTNRPPTGPLIAAGSTGAVPANAALLGVIAGLPAGAVVLPGLDLELADKAWSDIGEQHPQGAMKRLLEGAGSGRGVVRPWPGGGGWGRQRWRRRIVNEALRPAEATGDWRSLIADLRKEAADEGVDPFAEGLSGLTVIGARAEEEAAAVCALLLRETLATPGRTAALITPDQALARRVSARLSRWGVEVDSSAGAPLAEFPVGVLAALAAEAADDPDAPVGLLAILKHPLVRLGMAGADLRRARDDLEHLALRGPRRPGGDWIEQRLVAAAEPWREEAEAPPYRLEQVVRAQGLLERFRTAIALATDPYTGGTATPAEAARGLAAALEALAAEPDDGAGGLWAGPEGEAAAALLAALIQESEGLPEVTPGDFANLLGRLMESETVRRTSGAHPRLKILGAIESRLVHADRLILAGLEEGVWPRPAQTDPFLSRPMRKAFGLPLPERRIGLSAHDFAQAACAPDVVLLHCQRREGAPAVESRWLWRLRTLAKGAGLTLPGRPELLDWAAALDAPGIFAPAPRPRPRPPVEARPTALAVTGVETWVRDPYAIYARHVLKLKRLDRPDEPVEARLRGEAVHTALQRLVELHPEVLPEDADEVFRRLLVQALHEAGMSEPAMAREMALADQAAPWVVAFERRRRPGARLLVEQRGAFVFDAGDGSTFTLSARADRLEVRGGSTDILDFKTGSPPTDKQVKAGFAPQLTLTAAILMQGGFKDLGPMDPGQLMYVRVSGRRHAPDPKPLFEADKSAAEAEKALSGLRKRVAQFRSPDVPYASWRAPQMMSDWGGDYDHLARVWEWHVLDDADEATP